MAGVIETLSICGGIVPADEKTFWAEVASNVGVKSVAIDLEAMSRQVLEVLNESWDEDYVDETGALSVALYETLDDATRKAALRPASERDAAEEEETDSLKPFKKDLSVQFSTNWSIKSVYSEIKDGTLMLSPEWQRNFVWKAKKQKRLIESILLGLPIPSFLVFHDTTTGKKWIIDGRQRLETIVRFRSPKEKKGEERSRFKTFPKTEPGWGAKEVLGEAAGKYYDQLPPAHKSKFDSTPLVIAEFRDIELAQLYQVFKRYNTGAVALNAAEIRNAVYQASSLHQMMFRLAGEQRPRPDYKDPEEQRVSEDLRETLGTQRRQRYGTYDFIGRYFAFAYQDSGSVAQATVDFMDDKSNGTVSRVEELRREFIDVFNSASRWYAKFLVDPDEDRINVFLGTLQLTSTKVLLAHIAAGRCSVDVASEAVGRLWVGFARNRLRPKQNSGLFWNSQKAWITILELEIGIKDEFRRYPKYSRQDADKELSVGAEEAAVA